MFTKSQLNSMNYNRQYSSGRWINTDNSLDDNKLYKLYATGNATISSGREYIALPSDKILTENDYVKYNIQK
jgi:hypothetical protein